MKKEILFWLRITGWALLIHILLIALSFLEVFIYSVFFNPGQEQSVYEAHAKASAPFISIIFGAPVFFVIARYLTAKNSQKFRQIAFGLSLLYILFDLLMLLPYEVNWLQHSWVFLLSFGSKMAGSFYGAKSGMKKSNNNS